MQTLYWVYYLLLFINYLLYLAVRKLDRQLLPIGILLLFSLIVELFVEWHINRSISYYFLYHVYGPIEYVMLCLYFKNFLPQRLKKVVSWSILFVVPASLLISYKLISFTGYQGLNTAIRGTLIILIGITCLFSLPVENFKTIFESPAFTIITAYIIFFSGTLLSNGVYNGLLKQYPSEKPYYQKIHSFVNLSFNYLLYLLIATSLICLMAKKKYD